MEEHRTPGRRRFLALGLAATAASALPAAAFAGSALRVRSLRDGAPVAGARVRIGGRTLSTDAAGVLEVEAFPWSPVEIVADGHLTRRTCVREGGEIRLMPREPASPEELRQLVYFDGQLQRPAARSVDVVPHAAVAGHGRCTRALGAATVAAGAALGLSFRVVDAKDAAEPSAARPRVDVLVDAADPLIRAGARAVFYRRTRGATVLGGRVVLSSCGVAHDERTLVHELGHLLLGHSPVAGDLMAVDGGPAPQTFSARERAVLALVQDRAPGNRPEDDDSALGPEPQRVALGELMHRVVYAPGLTAESVFDAPLTRRASGPRQTVVCCA